MNIRLTARPRELSDDVLVETIKYASAVLVGAAYRLYDLAIAETMERAIQFPDHVSALTMPTAVRLHESQLALPRIDTAISSDWVTWASSTRDNWTWMAEYYSCLRQSYFHRFGCEPHLHLEMRRLWMHGPRPRPPGRTPFPEEPC